MKRPTPLINERNVRLLARAVNRAAASFKVADLSDEEVVEIYMLLDRLIDALWSEHGAVLLPINRYVLQCTDSPGDEELEGDDGHWHCSDDEDEPSN